MALVSPGVEVTIIDESIYVPAATNSVPYILIATAQNKAAGTGAGVAPGTLAAAAGRVFLVTSQRDLAATFGNPFFYKTAAGTPINGYELNEYGLLTAHSVLGVSNRAYVQRADIDLSELVASLSRPAGAPRANAYWLDSDDSVWGIFQWNQTTGAFTNKLPLVLTSNDQVIGDSLPLASIGSIGDYAVVTVNSNNPVYYKNTNNQWVLVGSNAWKTSWPTVQGSQSVSSALSAGNVLVINGVTVAVPVAPNNTITGLENAINQALIPGVTAAVDTSNRLTLLADSEAESTNSSTFGGIVNIEGTGIAQTFTVTSVANPGTPPPNNIYQIDGVNNPVLNLVRGGVYTFNQSAASNTNHPIAFRDSSDNAWTAGVVSTGTPGTAGAQTVFTVPANAPADLRYYCTVHGNGMGNDIAVTGSGSGSTSQLLTTLGITAGSYFAPELQQSPNFTVPRWRATDVAPRPTGSIWNMTTSVNQGANIQIKRFDAALNTFVIENSPVYSNDWAANLNLDPSGGGRNISQNTLYVQSNSGALVENNIVNNVLTYRVWRRGTTGPTRATGNVVNPTFVTGTSFSIRASQANSAELTAAKVVVIGGTTAVNFVEAVSAAGVDNVTAVIDTTGAIQLVHTQGGVIVVEDQNGAPLQTAGFVDAQDVTVEFVKLGTGEYQGALIVSNWVPLDYVASNTGPSRDPANGRLWYYSAVNQVDIMIQGGSSWQGYRNVGLDVRGYNLTQTDPAGPIISATEPIQQSDGTDLVYGDLWIDTSNLENYPLIKRWEQAAGVEQWVTLDNTDQTTSNGVLFADARWAPNGTTDPITDNLPSIQSLLTSNYLDLDAPDPSLFPTGTLLFNTRRTGFNVKRFVSNYFAAQDPNFAIPGYSLTTSYVAGNKVLYNGIIYVALASSTGTAPGNPSVWGILETNAWVTAAGNKSDGSPFMGRLAVRQMVIAAMKRVIDTQDTLREEQAVFNLMATPGYPELIPNMVALNNERSNTGFVVGDTPMRLEAQGNDIVAWATNNGGLGLPTGDGMPTSDSYLGVFYPSCETTDLTGSVVVQPPSHMMLRTIIRSDRVAYPWLAPAGVRRGVIDNASRIGYIDAATGEFRPIATGQGLRDVLYTNKINPITFIPGVGITNYGNKTESALPSALDRINVARLIAFIRGRLETVAKAFVFEPNDQITRNEISNAIDGLFQDLVAKRGVYDYLIVCDLSNNTPSRIDRNELYVDIAVEPVKAVEFIYIPVRIKNTGEISG